MLDLAIEGNPAFDMSTLELEREGPSYTVDTLEFLHSQYPGSELVLTGGRRSVLYRLRNWRSHPGGKATVTRLTSRNPCR